MEKPIHLNNSLCFLTHYAKCSQAHRNTQILSQSSFYHIHLCFIYSFITSCFILNYSMSCLSPIPYFMLFLLSYKKSGADFLCRSSTSSCSSTSWVPPNALEAPATSRSLYLSFLIYFEMEDKCFIMLLVSAIQQHQSAMLFAVQLPCRVKLFATPWTTACQTSLLLPIPRGLPKFMSIASVMPSNHLILCHPLLLLPSILPSIRVFPNELAVLIRWPKYWSFSISPSNEYSVLISFKID